MASLVYKIHEDSRLTREAYDNSGLTLEVEEESKLALGTQNARIGKRKNSRKVKRMTSDHWIDTDSVSSVYPCGRQAVSVNVNMAAYDPSLGEFDVKAASSIIFRYPQVSAFDNFTEDMRAIFLECESVFPNLATEEKKAKCFDEGKRRLLRLDKRLRKHLISFAQFEPFTSFISRMEKFLYNCVESEFDPTKESILVDEDKIECLRLASVEFCQVRSKIPAVKMRFKNPIFRVLTHSICQFHGLSSNICLESFNEKSTIVADGEDMKAINVYKKKEKIDAEWILVNDDVSRGGPCSLNRAPEILILNAVRCT